MLLNVGGLRIWKYMQYVYECVCVKYCDTDLFGLIS